MKKLTRFLLCSLIICSLFLFGCNNGTGSQSTLTPTGPDTNNSTSGEPATPLETTTLQETTTPSEEPSSTQEPTSSSQSTVDTTSPDYYGSLYTKEELEAMDNTPHTYGPGVHMDELNRPHAAIGAQNDYGKYDAYFIVPDDDSVYLTFDLGYEYNNNTNKILDILKEKGVKAVFFPTLDFAKRNPDTIRRIIDEGHELGNHSANHISMPTLSVDKMRDEIMIMHNYIYENYGYTIHLFRPPQGHFSDRSLALTQSLGYKTLIWSFAYYDYDTSKQPEYQAALTRVTEAAHPGALYLLHAVSNTNVEILPKFIDELRANNYNIALFH